jgi:hypothetical protein
MINRFKEFNNKKWATYTLISVKGMLTCFIIAAAGFKQVSGLVELAGIFQRLTIIFGFVWLTALSRLIIKASIQI